MTSLPYVSVNEASAEQMQILLGLTADEAAEILARRPFGTVQELQAALPERLPQRVATLDIPKLNLNDASTRVLEEVAKIPHTVAQRVIGSRPYFLMEELRPLLQGEADALGRIEQFFAIPVLTYLDKTTATQVRLTPEPSELLVRVKEQELEGARKIASKFRLRPSGAAAKGDNYVIFSVPQLESGTEVIAAAKSDPQVELVVPSFHDASDNSVFLDPDFCIVQFQDNVTPERAESLLTALHLDIYKRHRSAGLYTLKISGTSGDPAELSRALDSLNNSLLVKFAEPAYIGVNDIEAGSAQEEEVTGSAVAEAEAAGAGQQVPWNLLLVNAPEAWTRSRGSRDVVIAVIDTGIDAQHPSLQNAVLPRPLSESWNFSDDENPDPDDDDGHGTFIAGLFVGNDQLGVRGICPDCVLLPLKVPINSSTESYARRRDAILYALDYAGTRRLVINISWKTTGNVTLIHDALNLAVAGGAVVVCSAGNWPAARDQAHFPSDYVCTISVGGVGPDRRRAPYSFYGSAVDIAAPGGSGDDSPQGNIVSSSPGGAIRSDFGTSFSAPHVGGAAALLFSHDPGLSVAQVRQLIETSSAQLGDSDLGQGLLDIGAALSLSAQALQTPEPQGPRAHDGLTAVNSMSIDSLIDTFGLYRITASLLVQRRPYQQLEDIRTTLGMTVEHFDRISAYRGEIF